MTLALVLMDFRHDRLSRCEEYLNSKNQLSQEHMPGQIRRQSVNIELTTAAMGIKRGWLHELLDLIIESLILNWEFLQHN